MPKILIVEDDEKLAGELKNVLVDNGYAVEILGEFDDTAARIIDRAADLVLLDVNIPGLNGERVLKRVREDSAVPVIMLTSRSSEVDEVMSMSSGADDYVRKPYSAQVLLLRIEAILNRVSGKKVDNILRCGVRLCREIRLS